MRAEHKRNVEMDGIVVTATKELLNCIKKNPLDMLPFQLRPLYNKV